MRRRALHISAAVLALTAAFLTADGYEAVGYALSLALVAFILANGRPCVDFHFLMVAALSISLWVAGAYALFSTLSAFGDSSCVLEFGGEEAPRSLNAVPQDTVITLERTGCYGRCPGYALSIFADGAVVYYGVPRNGFTKVAGAARSWISQEQLRRLVAEFERVDYFSLKDRYEAADGCPTFRTDSPWVITSLQINGRKKTVHHYHGCGMKGSYSAVFPRELTDLERMVDEVTGSERWVNIDR